ncbi:TonB-dependent siderophore receptor [Celeribacter sp. ULVN23_4]
MTKIKRGVALTLSALMATTALVNPVLAQDATDLEPILIEGYSEDSDGPVEGYAAEGSSSATGSNIELVETPVTVNVIGQEQMEDQGATSVAEALRYTAGVSAEYRGSSNLSDETQLRGFGDRTFVPKFLDGLSFGRGIHAQLDPFYLERIEVVKGPNSVAYGQVTPGGLIAMTSKKPTDGESNRVEVAVGSDEYMRFSGDFQGTLDDEGRLKYRFVGSAWQKNLQGDFDQNRFFIAPSLEWAVSDATKVTVTALYQNEPDAGNRGFMPYYGIVEPTEDGILLDDDFQSWAPDYDSVERETKSVGYEIEHELSGGWKLEHSLRYTELEISQTQVGMWDPVEYGTDDSDFYLYRFLSEDSAKTLVGDVNLTGQVQTGALTHDLSFGVDYVKNEVDSSYARSAADLYVFSLVDMNYPDADDIAAMTLDGYSYTSTSDLTQTGVYAQDRITFGDWALLLGGRYDWSEVVATRDGSNTGTYEDEAFTGRAALSYTTAFGLVPYVSYSTSFEPVTSLDDDGDASFDPTTGEQWEIGAKWQSSDKRFLVSAAYFDITKKNITESDPVTDETVQIGEIRSKGFEIEARGELTDQLSLIASYFNTDATYESGDDEGNTFYAVPTEQAALWVKYAVNDAFDVSLGARYTGKSYGDSANTIVVPSYTLFDAGFGLDLGEIWQSAEGVNANLSIQNLTDERYVASCVRSYCWLGEGRNFQASISYEW